MRLPKALSRVIEDFERLPGVGPKSAQRLAFYLLHVPQSNLEQFANDLVHLKKETVLCSLCYNIGDIDPCFICADPGRDKATLCVVEDALDVLAIERSGKYGGVYHVLHGVVDPLNSIGPDDIYIPQLLSRVKTLGSDLEEIIFATNPTMEGEATAMYIVRQLKEKADGVKLTRIGHGLPIGADIEYADETTLDRALEGRREY
ncbi:MAG: recombination protein RecR [Candidatus Levybacteria bacterium]|nr:recombination protein RecR [Candidatus Levybacteria bacterium]MBP9815057.1 recombination protein RecR [Candidatus Levybacteria bacterium]